MADSQLPGSFVPASPVALHPVPPSERGLTLGSRRLVPAQGCGNPGPGCRAGPGEASTSSLRSWPAQRPPCSFETWKVLPVRHSPLRAQARQREKASPSGSSVWLIKWIFLWVFWWNNLFLASKSSARGLDLPRDQLCVTTALAEAGTPQGWGGRAATHRAGEGGSWGGEPRRPDWPRAPSLLFTVGGRACASAPHLHPISSHAFPHKPNNNNHSKNHKRALTMCQALFQAPRLNQLPSFSQESDLRTDEETETARELTGPGWSEGWLRVRTRAGHRIMSLTSPLRGKWVKLLKITWIPDGEAKVPDTGLCPGTSAPNTPCH